MISTNTLAYNLISAGQFIERSQQKENIFYKYMILNFNENKNLVTHLDDAIYDDKNAFSALQNYIYSSKSAIDLLNDANEIDLANFLQKQLTIYEKAFDDLLGKDIDVSLNIDEME